MQKILALMCLVFISSQSAVFAADLKTECQLAQSKEIANFKKNETIKEIRVHPGITPLQIAISNGNLEEVKRLVANGASIHGSSNELGGSPLGFAAQGGRNEIVLYFLANGANVDRDISPALPYAVASGQVKTASILIEHGADINADSALLQAIQYGSFEMVKFLLSKGANVNLANKETTPIARAAAWGNVKIVKMLIDHGANKDEPTNGDFPIISASSTGNFAVVKYLTEIDTNINVIDKNGRNALLYAAQNGHLGTACYLLEKGVYKDQKDVEGITPLMAALGGGHKKIVSLLQTHGAKADLDTQLLSATILKNTEKAHDLLLQGADPNSHKIYKMVGGDAIFQFPLLVAAKNGQIKMVDLLLAHGANPNVSSNAHTALLYAAKNGNLALAKLLVKKGADVNKMADIVADDVYSTPLIEAAVRGDLDFVKFLLKEGADINLHYSETVEGYGCSPLVMALRSNQFDVATFFIKQGADVNSVGYPQESALAIAKEKKHKVLIKFLEDLGAQEIHPSE